MLAYVFVLGFWVIWRGVAVQKIHTVWKILLSVAILLIAGKFYVLRVFSGAKSFFNPELPSWVLIPAAWLFAVLIFFFFWLIFYDFCCFVCSLLCRWRKWKLPCFFKNQLWRIVGLVPAAILVSIGIYGGLKTPAVTCYDIEVNNLPAEVEGMKIVHLSDLHVDPLTGAEKVRAIVDIANAQSGDLIVITGDFVDGRTAVRGKDLQFISGLRAPLGVYGVPGNHEYYSGYQEWMDFLNGHGVKMLENSSVKLKENFFIGGVTDLAYRQKGGDKPDINKAFAGVPEKSFKLLLAHQPKLALVAADAGVDLQLSGHTHGGMIWGLDLLVGFFNKGLVSGTYDVKNMKLHISNGTGIWNGFPIRLGYPSEIVVLTLRNKR